jgi:hypothetical protein
MATSQTFPTPEAAAMLGFPPEHCRVLAIDVDGDDAFFVLDTGPAEYRYLYSGTVRRVGDGWISSIDGNGGGVCWTRTDDARELGVVALSDEAPSDSDAVRVSWRGRERESLVRNGVYLVTWWQEPFPEDSWPAVVAFRIADRWVDAISPRGSSSAH